MALVEGKSRRTEETVHTASVCWQIPKQNLFHTDYVRLADARHIFKVRFS